MSKSSGNALSPQDVIKQSGADILRLWVSVSDYTDDMPFGPQILARTATATARSATPRASCSRT